jgi:type I restriction enzyme, S subunit
LKSKAVQEFKETEVGKIPTDWTVKKLREIADVIDPHPSHRAPKITSNGFPFAGIGDIDFDGTINVKKSRKISEEFVKQQEQSYEINDYSIGYGRVGTVGKIVRLRKQKFRYAISPTLAIINPNENIDNIFLNYAIRTSSFSNQVNAKMTGSTRPALGIQELRKIIVVCPTINEQKIIGKNLDDLTSKIQNLQNQNKILEQIAQAIFKSWFVDFDGVTEWDDSELGKIPKGWSVKKFSDVSNILSGGTPSTKNPNFWNGEIKWIAIDDLKQGMFILDSEKKITQLGLDKSSAKILPVNSIVISARGTVGVFSIMSESMTINQSCYGLTGKGIVNEVFLFFLLHFSLNNFIQNVHGTVFDTITRKTFDEINIIFPNDEKIVEFQNSMKSSLQKIQKIQIQIQSLTKTRDALLPKLMSGEIRV